jgi:hypothetical protein
MKLLNDDQVRRAINHFGYGIALRTSATEPAAVYAAIGKVEGPFRIVREATEQEYLEFATFALGYSFGVSAPPGVRFFMVVTD